MIVDSVESQRGELHRGLWAVNNVLRNNVDGWDFKHYVFTILFYRFISENFTFFVNTLKHNDNDHNFDYTAISDCEAEGMRDELIELKGFFMYPSQLFSNITNKVSSIDDLGVTVNSILVDIENSTQGSILKCGFSGLFEDVDFTSKKLGVTVSERNKKIGKLVGDVQGIRVGDYCETEIDVFGDSFEYLMGMYASNGGKSGGEYYTPQEVSELLAKLVIGDRTCVNSVYDPACGTGSLLLKFHQVLGVDNVRNGFSVKRKI